MKPTLRLLCRPDTWKRSFRYAAAVDFALQPPVLRENAVQVVAIRELREARIFRHIGLPWYLAAILVTFLLALGAGAVYGAWLMLANGSVLGVLGAGAFCVLIAALVIGMGCCLELIARAGAQASRAVAAHDLRQFMSIVSRYDPHGASLHGERTYLDLALYAAGFRRRLAASPATPLDVTVELDRHLRSGDPDGSDAACHARGESKRKSRTT